MKKIKITVLAGDGIGREVMDAALPVFDIFDIPVELTFGDVGWEYWKKEGNPLPERTWQIIKQSDATLLGAITSKPEREAYQELVPQLSSKQFNYVSPVIQLRQGLDLFANIRPCFSINDEKAFNFCVIRENTEGLYAGFDFHPTPDNLKAILQEKSNFKNTSNEELSCSLRVQSLAGLTRLFEFAFSYADKNNYKRITLADKPNVLRKSGAFAREIYEKIAVKYPHINADILNVDALALWLVKCPEKFGVIVAENMFGDILSDLGAAVMGGLGFAPSANIGNKGCYFEPVHGSAPAIKANQANPSAMFLTIGLLLKHFGYDNEAKRIENAIKTVVKDGQNTTYDVGGNATTNGMAEAILAQCSSPKIKKLVSFISTGSEIINGEISETNAKEFSKTIYGLGGNIYQHICVSDKQIEIKEALKYVLKKSDAVIVTGGLGPTSDDCTRFAVSDAVEQELVFNEKAWNHVVNRLKRFNLKLSENNKQQAFFPKNSTIISNENGTALGCHIKVSGKDIFMLPGPPKESLPMFNSFVLPQLNLADFFTKKNNCYWLTMGLIEGEIAPIIDKIVSGTSVKTGYRWSYPYIEIKITEIPETEIADITAKINNILAPNLISLDGKNAFELLDAVLCNSNLEVLVHDHVTQNILSNEFKKYKKLVFMNDSESKVGGLIAKNPVFTISASRPLVDEIAVNRTNSLDNCGNSGSIDFYCEGYCGKDLVLKHQISTPYRDKEIFEFIKSYFAWQLSQFVEIIKGWIYEYT